jgi:Short-chain dehydrogenases of various substrate specificities
MVKNGEGNILNVASTGAYQPGPYISTYYASKAYVLSFSQAIRNELKIIKLMYQYYVLELHLHRFQKMQEKRYKKFNVSEKSS